MWFGDKYARCVELRSGPLRLYTHNTLIETGRASEAAHYQAPSIPSGPFVLSSLLIGPASPAPNTASSVPAQASRGCSGRARRPATMISVTITVGSTTLTSTIKTMRITSSTTSPRLPRRQPLQHPVSSGRFCLKRVAGETMVRRWSTNYAVSQAAIYRCADDGAAAPISVALGSRSLEMGGQQFPLHPGTGALLILQRRVPWPSRSAASYLIQTVSARSIT